MKLWKRKRKCNKQMVFVNLIYFCYGFVNISFWLHELNFGSFTKKISIKTPSILFACFSFFRPFVFTCVSAFTRAPLSQKIYHNFPNQRLSLTKHRKLPFLLTRIIGFQIWSRDTVFTLDYNNFGISGTRHFIDKQPSPLLYLLNVLSRPKKYAVDNTFLIIPIINLC